MVHELLGIQNGRVDLRMVPDIRPELSVRSSSGPHCVAHLTLGNYIDNLN